MRRIGARLKDAGFRNVVPIPFAGVPIVKFEAKIGNQVIQADINTNERFGASFLTASRAALTFLAQASSTRASSTPTATSTPLFAPSASSSNSGLASDGSTTLPAPAVPSPSPPVRPSLLLSLTPILTSSYSKTPSSYSFSPTSKLAKSSPTSKTPPSSPSPAFAQPASGPSPRSSSASVPASQRVSSPRPAGTRRLSSAFLLRTISSLRISGSTSLRRGSLGTMPRSSWSRRRSLVWRRERRSLV